MDGSGEGGHMAESASAADNATRGSQISAQTAQTQINAESTQARTTAQQNDPEDPGTGGINPTTAAAKLRAAQTATTAAIGAGFEFTPEQIEAQLTQCQRELYDLNNDLRIAQDAVQAVHEPAPDAASVGQADAVRNMLNSTVGMIRADIAYLTDWQAKLVAAKTNYQTNEHLTEAQWSRQATGL